MKEFKKAIVEAVQDSIDLTDNQVSISVLNNLLDEILPEQLRLYGVVRSFLVKESESLGVEVNDLYLHLYDDKLYLEKEDTESFYFELEDVREVE